MGYGWRQNREAKLKIVGGAIFWSNHQLHNIVLTLFTSLWFTVYLLFTSHGTIAYSDHHVFLKVLENKYLEIYKFEGLAFIYKANGFSRIILGWDD